MFKIGGDFLKLLDKLFGKFIENAVKAKIEEIKEKLTDDVINDAKTKVKNQLAKVANKAKQEIDAKLEEEKAKLNEAIEANKINKQRREAIIEFGKLTLDQMRKCLRLFGLNGERMSNELVESTLFNLVDKQPKKFFDLWVNNKSKDTQFILEEAVAKGVIRKQHTQYYYGTEMIADSLNDAIAYLDNKKNQDLKLAIINETKNK